MNTFKVLCVYDMMLVLLKWNGKMLVKWLSDQFWRYWDGRCWNHARCVCSKKTARLLHSYRDMVDAEHAGLCKLTFAAWYLQILVHITIWFKCNDLLLINSSKLWQIPWHSALNCKFRFYDWIPRFRPCFLHRGNHRALIIEWFLKGHVKLKTGEMAAEYIISLLKYIKIVVKVIFTILLFLLFFFIK